LHYTSILLKEPRKLFYKTRCIQTDILSHLYFFRERMLHFLEKVQSDLFRILKVLKRFPGLCKIENGA